jgi:indolepyruvate ferredoxin oxidoreductase beta subunit
MQTSILIIGVGGQGTLLASRVIGNAAIRNGWDVKVSEVHGMSQRGGSVVTYVRLSDKKVASPIIDGGGADYVLAFELLEALRGVQYLKKGGKMIINTQQINPMPVIIGDNAYPEGILEKFDAAGLDYKAFDALTLAQDAGSDKSVNIVLLGVLATMMGMPKDFWLDVMKETIPPALLEVNLKAFENGYERFTAC